MSDIQSAINELAKKTDKRTSVFDIEIQWLKNSTLSLSGRVLHEAQLVDLRHALPDLKLDMNAVRILSRESLGPVHVGTNLTGLYENPTFGMPLSSELTYGTELEVLDVEHRWALTRQRDGYLGWAYRPYLREGPAPKPTHLVIAPVTEMHDGPGEASDIVTRLVSGTAVTVEDSRAGWSCIQAHRSGWLPSKHLRPLSALPETFEGKRALLIEDSMRMLGVPYLWGGTSGNGIDCSGFARLLHQWIGIQIPRDADMQHAASRPVEPPFEPGDLFFFAEEDDKRNISHVGMSLGGWKMIHSSRSRNGVYVDDLQEEKSLMSTFVSAGSFIRER